MKLSKRLTAAGSFLPQGGVLADVGADRGELSFHLLSQNRVNRAILTDISKNSLNRAVELFRPTPLWEKAEFRVGDGLTVLEPGEVQSIVMAGMGGQTITDILSAGGEVSLATDTIVVQAMGNSQQVRKWLGQNSRKITEEAMVWEDGHYYTIIKTQRGEMELTDIQIYAGPILLKNKDPLLRESLTREREERMNILSLLTQKSQGEKRQQVLKEEISFLNSIISKL